MTIAALRRLLAEVDAQGGPAAARADRLALPQPISEATRARAWAAARGLACPPTGPLPWHIRRAWHAAGHPPLQPSTGTPS